MAQDRLTIDHRKAVRSVIGQVSQVSDATRSANPLGSRPCRCATEASGAPPPKRGSDCLKHCWLSPPFCSARRVRLVPPPACCSSAKGVPWALVVSRAVARWLPQRRVQSAELQGGGLRLNRTPVSVAGTGGSSQGARRRVSRRSAESRPERDRRTRGATGRGRHTAAEMMPRCGLGAQRPLMQALGYTHAVDSGEEICRTERMGWNSAGAAPLESEAFMPRFLDRLSMKF